jgi:hypothetical protein
MARYFNFFPKTFYLTDNKATGLESVTNIIARFAFESSLKGNSAVFYEYEIKDSDTPEIIASKFYDNPERHWIVLLFNDIIDPQYDWPLESRVLNNFIDKKYSAPEYADTANTSVPGLSWAKNANNVKSYFKIITTISSTGEETSKRYEIDAMTYANTGSSSSNFTLQDGSVVTQIIDTETQTYYEFESQENEKKRVINLLKPEFVPAVEKEFKRVVRL